MSRIECFPLVDVSTEGLLYGSNSVDFETLDA